MRKPAFAVILVTALAGTIALAGGTRSLTDVKGPVFAAGALLAGLVLFAGLLRKQEASTGRCGLLFPVAGFTWLAFTAFSHFWAEHPWIVRYVLANRFLMLLLALSTAAAIAGQRQWLTFSWAYAALGAGTALFTLGWHGIYVPLRLVAASDPAPPFAQALKHALRDVKAPLGNANLLGGFLLLPMAMAAGLALREWRGKKRGGVFLLLAALAAPAVVVFCLCGSLSAAAGLLSGAAVFAFLRAKRKLPALAAIAVLAAGAAAAFYFSGASGRLAESRTYLLRMEYWRRAAVMARRRPLAGYGAGNFYTVNQPIGAATAFKKVTFDNGAGGRSVPLYQVLGNHHPSAAHNAYLDQAAEGGVIGLALFLAVLAVPLARGFSARRDGFDETAVLDAALGAYAAFLVIIGVTMNLSFADFAPHFWILAGLIVASGPPAPRVRTAGAAGRLAAAGVIAAVAVWGLYEFAFRDFRSSMEYEAGLEARRRSDEAAAAPLFKAAAADTWDPLLRVWSLDMLARSYMARGDGYLQSAHRIARELGAMVDGYNGLLLGAVLEKSGDYDGALEAYRRHAIVRPAEPGIRRRILFAEAMAVLEAGGADAYGAGLEYFRRFPGDAAGRRVYFQRLLEDGEKALDALSILAEGLDPGDPSDRYLLGRLEFVRGEYREAARLMESAFEAGCRARGINRYLVLAYMELGRPEKAREVLARGLEINPTCKSLQALRERLEAGEKDAGGARSDR